MANTWKNNFWKPGCVVKTTVLNLPKDKRGITKVYFVEDLGRTPACCLRSTGEMWISLKHWRVLPYEHKVFIILHENAHIVLNSSNELEVDELAHEQYMAMGYSLTESIRALTQVLSYSNSEHMARTIAQMTRACVYDIRVNNNKQLENYLKTSKPKFFNK